MSLIDDLRSVRGLFAECPRCGENFALREANLFDATKRLPRIAVEYLQTQRTEIACEINPVRRADDQYHNLGNAFDNRPTREQVEACFLEEELNKPLEHSP